MAGFDIKGSYLTQLVENSADALGNLYLVEFENSTSGGEDIEIPESMLPYVTVRTKEFSWSMPSQESYEIKFLTAKINRPKAFVKVDHSFSFTLRVDSYYNVYAYLLKYQKNTTFNPEEGWAHNNIEDIKDKLMNIQVSLLKRKENSSISSKDLEQVKIAKFNHCWIESIDPISFKTGTADPVEIKVNMKFLELNDGWDESSTSTT